jgi:hypothetical protein
MFWEIDWLHGNIRDIDGTFGQECIIMRTGTLIKTTDYYWKLSWICIFQEKELPCVTYHWWMRKLFHCIEWVYWCLWITHNSCEHFHLKVGKRFESNYLPTCFRNQARALLLCFRTSFWTCFIKSFYQIITHVRSCIYIRRDGT